MQWPLKLVELMSHRGKKVELIMSHRGNEGGDSVVQIRKSLFQEVRGGDVISEELRVPGAPSQPEGSPNALSSLDGTGLKLAGGLLVRQHGSQIRSGCHQGENSFGRATTKIVFPSIVSRIPIRLERCRTRSASSTLRRSEERRSGNPCGCARLPRIVAPPISRYLRTSPG